ncbi:hypothetical protein QYF36_025189 [Acer negundo]|nr:hypothetical protein QYF36_025189 [Acer negundo]
MAQVGKDKALAGSVSWKEEESSGEDNSAVGAGTTTSVKAKPTPKRHQIAFFGPRAGTLLTPAQGQRCSHLHYEIVCSSRFTFPISELL